MRNSYTISQTVKDAQYKQFWDNAPPEFLEEARKAGIGPQVDGISSAMEYDDNHEATSVNVQMPSEIDTFIDHLIERHGIENAAVVRAVADDLKRIMDIEIERNRALSLGRMLFYLVKSETRNIKASLYAAMHSIPRLAAANGMLSMRDSARACGVSPEWIRRSRDEICNILQIPIPSESTKSVDARAKYAMNGRSNHWRKQTTKKGQKICKQKVTTVKPNSTLLLELAKHSALQKRGSRSEKILPLKSGGTD
jgi:hypothetical protein